MELKKRPSPLSSKIESVFAKKESIHNFTSYQSRQGRFHESLLTPTNIINYGPYLFADLSVFGSFWLAISCFCLVFGPFRSNFFNFDPTYSTIQYVIIALSNFLNNFGLYVYLPLFHLLIMIMMIVLYIVISDDDDISSFSFIQLLRF